jgi:hypothetical protein
MATTGARTGASSAVCGGGRGRGCRARTRLGGCDESLAGAMKSINGARFVRDLARAPGLRTVEALVAQGRDRTR